MTVEGSLVEDARTLSGSCRAVVVGAGLAGAQVAKAAEAHGMTGVVVLDAGPGADLRHVNVRYAPEAALRAWLRPETDECFERTWASRAPPHYSGPSGLRRRVGGRSLYWHGVVLPIERWALADPRWPSDVVADLCDTWDGGPSLYERATSELRDGGPLDGLAPPSGGVTLAGNALRVTPRAVRRGTADPSRWYAYSPLDRWRDPETGVARRRPSGVRFFADVEVLEVVVRDGAARGVVAVSRAAGGDAVRLAAETVTLAAGTLENSRLALRALADAGEPRARLGGLADHIVQGVFARAAGEHAQRLLSWLAPGSYWTPCAAVRSNLFLELRPLDGGDVVVELALYGEQLPSDESWVSYDPAERPPQSIQVRAGLSAGDVALIADQRAVLEDASADLARVAGWPAWPLRFADYERPERTNSFVLESSIAAAAPNVPFTWSSCLGTEDHEGGTLPLGGVVDSDQQMAAVPGLFVAGPASFPRLGAANPALTIVALANRLAAGLADR